MPEQHFPICTPDVPPMLGRAQIMDRLVKELTKTSPSHRSVVGARFIGKSVILHDLAGRMRERGDPFCAVVEWDLGHSTPQSDVEFLRGLCQRLGQGLADAGQDVYGEHLKEVATDYYSELETVIDSMDSDGLRVLMLWDGFDKPLSTGTLPRNLWDNLRELCLKDGFRLVTATRRELHDLIRDEKSVTSDFWNIFGDVVRVGPMDDADLDAVLAALPDHQFEAGARAELKNWSGGNPPLLLALLNAVCEGNSAGSLSNQDVNAAAPSAKQFIEPVLKGLWDDCSAPARDLYASLADGADLALADTHRAERTQLQEKGLAKVSGQRITESCRFLRDFISGAGPDAGSMGRLFGDWDGYQTNIRALLERRLAQIPNFDHRLIRLVARAIEDIPDFPDDCLNNLTGIRDRALATIWEREFGASRVFSPEVIAYWTESTRNGQRFIQEMMHKDDWTIPADPGLQLRALQYLTGSYQRFESKAKTSKDTYVLLNAIHSYRNRGEHSDGQQMHVGVAVAAMMTCVELVGCLAREGGRHHD